MAKRPIFVPVRESTYVREVSVEFEWFAGFAVTQKQRSVRALHQAASEAIDVERILEVSTKSEDQIGASLSAFRLQLRSEILDRTLSVEAAFQGSKVFEQSGQHPEIYLLESGREIKGRMAAFASEKIEGFSFEGSSWPTTPRTAFYDWIYLRALADKVRGEELDSGTSDTELRLLGYDGFTDIEFNPDRSINCQARSCALFVALHRQGLIDRTKDRDSYLELVADPRSPQPSPRPQSFDFG